MSRWDVIVVGAGPAGLACALWLGRYRRSVCVFDTAEPRNEDAWAVHGFPGLLDPTPGELRGRMRHQARLAGAQFVIDEVCSIRGTKDDFRVSTASGQEHQALRIVLAYGLRDHLPDVPGLPSLYGRAVFHCVDCDGPEAVGRKVGVIGHDRSAAALALALLHWSGAVSLLTHGHRVELDEEQRATLRQEGVAVHEQRIARLDATDGMLHGAELEDGSCIPAERIFFHVGAEPRTLLAQELACEVEHDDYIRVSRGQETSTPGVYAAGDITGHPHLASTAAADGIRAALAIHRSLLLPSRKI